MKTAIIVDDERKSIESLAWKLEQSCPEIQLLRSFQSASTALDFLSDNSSDLVFLDIDMPEMNGLEFAKRISHQELPIIFVTAHKDFALEAIKLEAFDYLLKPIKIAELKDCINRLKIKILKKEVNQKYSLKSTKNEKLALHTSSNIYYLDEEKILYCASESNYTMIYLEDGSKKLVTRTLKKIEDELSGLFIRTHKSFLVNKKFVMSYQKGAGGSLELNNKKVIPVSKSRKEKVLEALSK